MATHEIIFQTDGTGRCLYTEAIDLSAVGRLAIARATTTAPDIAAPCTMRVRISAWMSAAVAAARLDSR